MFERIAQSVSTSSVIALKGLTNNAGSDVPDIVLVFRQESGENFVV